MADTQQVDQTPPNPPAVGQSGGFILPAPLVPSKAPSIFGPDYSFSDAIPMPDEVGVYDGDSVASVMDAGKAAAFYADTIGFGQSSNKWSAGFTQLKPVGVNTFVQSGQLCSNGAKMWQYIQGIPTGDGLGKTTQDRLASAGLPKIRGLAGGILEDLQTALNPGPVLSSVYGTGNASCVYTVNQVGDQDGNVKNPGTGNWYVENPEDVTCTGGGTVDQSTGKCASGKPMQGRWVHSANLTIDQFNSTVKTICQDGYPKVNHRDGDCLKELQSKVIAGFSDMGVKGDSREMRLLKMVGALAGVLLAVAAADYFISCATQGKLKR
jgi:hypothetical protein